MDPGLNSLLKWSTQYSNVNNNGDNSNNNNNNNEPPSGPRGVAAEALKSLFCDTVSDAEMMQRSMAAVKSEQVSVEDKVVAFDNFEQLVENIDNANNMEKLGLWQPLVDELKDEEPEMRKMAAWCIGTAVQNNVEAQNKLIDYNAIPTLAESAQNDAVPDVRKKSIYALSCSVRNNQRVMDILVQHLPETILETSTKEIDSSDMDRIDKLMSKLREQIHP